MRGTSAVERGRSGATLRMPCSIRFRTSGLFVYMPGKTPARGWLFRFERDRAGARVADRLPAQRDPDLEGAADMTWAAAGDHERSAALGRPEDAAAVDDGRALHEDVEHPLRVDEPGHDQVAVGHAAGLGDVALPLEVPVVDAELVALGEPLLGADDQAAAVACPVGRADDQRAGVLCLPA